MTIALDTRTDQALLPRKARRDLGREARTRLPVEAHGALAPSDRDPVAVLERQAESRVPSLIALRHSRMASSAFAFYRGAAALMADDLREVPDSGIATHLCGDAHLSNVGVFASPERSLVIDLNDFDETAQGPFEWDVKRMAASFEIAARARGFDDETRARIVMRVVRAYGAAMREAARTPLVELFTARLDMEDVLTGLSNELATEAAERAHRIIAKSRRRDSRQAANSLAERVDGIWRFRSDPPLLVPFRHIAEESGITNDEAEQRIRDIFDSYRDTLAPERRRVLDRFRMVDAAMKVVGVGSVGTRAWVVLFQGNGKNDVLMLQAKEAQQSVLEPPGEPSAYTHQGQRVVHGQRIMQALGDVLLGWTTGTGIDGHDRDFYVRQFRDWKGSAEPEIMEPSTMRIYAEYCGIILARAHARGGDPAVISGYVGDAKDFARAVLDFSVAYADRTEADHRALLAAIADGRVEASAS
jgi:uncharacterized protein (DUF2252 family)